MKRQLSLLLAVVMILGSFSFAFAAEEDFDVAAFLEEEGILVGNDSGDLMLDEALLRKDAVVLLARLLDEEAEAEAFEKEGLPTFNDLADNPYYKGFLGWAEDNGYFTGNPDGSFGYEENLEAKQYAIVLLRALGYVNDDKADEWSKAWDEAEDLGLLEEVEAEAREEILREEVAQMTFNALGVEMKDSDETLAEFLGIEMPEEDELEVVEVYTENLAEVVVELSNAKLVKNKEALTNPNNYRLNDSNVKVYNVDVDGNDVVLTLVPYGRVDEQGDFGTLVKGRDYKLTIRNIEGISQTEEFEAKDVAVPTVEKVEFIGTYGIKVTTSEPIDNPQERNFRVDDRRTSMIIEQYGRDLILTPYHESKFDEDATELVVDEIKDFNGYRAATTFEDMELSSDDATPVVEKAYRSGDKLTLVFDRDIYRGSVSEYKNRRNEGNVSFVERRVIFTADTAEKVDTNVAVYEFEREIPRDAVITVEGVQNHFKEAMEAQEVETELYVDDYAPVVISKLSVNVTSTDNQTRGEETESTKGLKIEFDKDIRELVDAIDYVEEEIEDIDFADEDAEDAAIKTALNEYFADDLDDFFEVYRLEVSRKGKNDAEDVKLVVEDVKSDSITISFEDIVVNDKYRDYDYILEVQDFTDLNRNRMIREYIDFQIVPQGADFDVNGEVVVIKAGYNVEVVIEYNQAVDKDEAEDVKNYFFGKEKVNAKKLPVDTAIVERDGKTVSLVIRDTSVSEFLADYPWLEISPRVTNIDGDSIAGSRFFELKSEADVEEMVEYVEGLITELTALNEMTLDDKEDVEAAREAYDALRPTQQKAVSNLKALEAAEAKIDELEKEEKEAGDVEAANELLNDKITAMETEVNSGTLETMKAALTAANADEVKAAKEIADELIVSRFVVALDKLEKAIEELETAAVAVAEVPKVKAESDLSAIAAAMKDEDKIKAADDAIAAAKELGVTDETIKAIDGYNDYIATKELLNGIEEEEGIVDYDAVLNTDHTDESIKDHYFIKVTVTGNLDSDSVSAIYSVDSGKDLNPDTDTVLWFRVASKDDTKTPLHEDGTYTYLVKTKNGEIYSFTHTFKFENVEFPEVEPEP